MREMAVAVALLVTFSLVLTVVYSSESDAENLSDSFSLRLTDSEGNDLSDPLFGGGVTVFFDTYDTEHGTLYKLKAMLSIKTIPANLEITAPDGLFKVAVSATGLGSYIDETGLRVTLTDSGSGSVFNADLRKSNGYSAGFKNGANVAAVDPNVSYDVSVSLIGEYSSYVPPEQLQDIKITFQAIASEGFHQVVFVSQDNVVDSYLAFDGYVIGEVPTVSRIGYTFKGWFTPDGRQIADGYVITANDGDIYAIAVWEQDEGFSMMLYVGIGGVAVASLLLLLFLLKKGGKDDAA